MVRQEPWHVCIRGVDVDSSTEFSSGETDQILQNIAPDEIDKRLGLVDRSSLVGGPDVRQQPLDCSWRDLGQLLLWLDLRGSHVDSVVELSLLLVRLDRAVRRASAARL